MLGEAGGAATVADNATPLEAGNAATVVGGETPSSGVGDEDFYAVLRLILNSILIPKLGYFKTRLFSSVAKQGGPRLFFLRAIDETLIKSPSATWGLTLIEFFFCSFRERRELQWPACQSDAGIRSSLIAKLDSASNSALECLTVVTFCRGFFC